MEETWHPSLCMCPRARSALGRTPLALPPPSPAAARTRMHGVAWPFIPLAPPPCLRVDYLTQLSLREELSSALRLRLSHCFPSLVSIRDTGPTGFRPFGMKSRPIFLDGIYGRARRTINRWRDEEQRIAPALQRSALRSQRMLYSGRIDITALADIT